ncbi:helix-turn-helix domain-containing protein [Thalassotalea sp. Y01]|uniref:AraC family transcriptional regulator n=1 Tax=Thalassotalea sp. Y01 TaxID=2729613 RepID=UPI00145DDABB|nr:helix-turn-helix domain-containing protein [Thalassotalea sp. Y01]NMP17597.1 AraC family transcriptional regulator [Thalassotalea sp. Y01]
MTDFPTFLAISAFALMIMVLVILTPSMRDSQQVRWYALLMLSAALYLLPAFSPISEYPTLAFFIATVSNLIPGIFLLTSLSLFSDRQEIKYWHLGVAALPAIILLPAQIASVSSIEDTSSLYFSARIAALIADIGLVTYALYVAMSNWRNDLVQARRMIRVAVISATGLYMFLVIVPGQVFAVHGAWLTSLQMLLLCALLLSIHYFLFKANVSSLFEPPQQQSQPIPSAIDNEDIAVIERAMSDDKLYRQEGLTIASLASHCQIVEYKLRQLINGQLGYRNFNDFLNGYRVKEVSLRLLLAEEAKTPILSMALDAGFRSLSSFNKVFKATYQMTPSEYRKTQNTD